MILNSDNKDIFFFEKSNFYLLINKLISKTINPKKSESYSTYSLQ